MAPTEMAGSPRRRSELAALRHSEEPVGEHAARIMSELEKAVLDGSGAEAPPSTGSRQEQLQQPIYLTVKRDAAELEESEKHCFCFLRSASALPNGIGSKKKRKKIKSPQTRR